MFRGYTYVSIDTLLFGGSSGRVLGIRDNFIALNGAIRGEFNGLRIDEVLHRVNVLDIGLIIILWVAGHFLKINWRLLTEVTRAEIAELNKVLFTYDRALLNCSADVK